MRALVEKQSVQYIQSILGSWVKKYKCQLISPDRVLPTSIVAAAIFNSEHEDQIFAFGASTLWLFGVDRWFDENKYKNENVFNKFSFFESNEFRRDNSEIVEVAATFEDIHDFLSKFKSFEKNRHLWYASLMNVLFLGMAHERQENLNLTFDQYLYYARESIGVKFVNYTTFISMNLSLKFEHHIYFDSIQNLSAEIIRLMNDLVTNSKEMKEGKKNALSFLGTGIENPTKWIKDVIIKKEARLSALVNGGPEDLAIFSNYVQSLVKTTLAFYRESDFYDGEQSLKQKHIK